MGGKMKNVVSYMKLNYNTEIKCMPDGMFCAEIKEIPGLCAYADSMKDALDELEFVKKDAFELMLSQYKNIPLPLIRLEIPINSYEKLSNKEQLMEFIV